MVVLITAFGLSLSSCLQESDILTKNASQLPQKSTALSTTPKIDTAAVLQFAHNSMLAFIDKVKTRYTNGMSYAELKHSIDPRTNLGNMSVAGDRLLHKAYYHIVNNTAEDDIHGGELMKAIEYVAQQNIDNGTDLSFSNSMNQYLLGIEPGHTASGFFR